MSERIAALLHSFRRRRLFLMLWDAAIVAVFFGIAPLLITAFFGFRITQLPLYAAAATIGLYIKIVRQKEDPVLLLDRLADVDGKLITLFDMYERLPSNPYVPLLQARIECALNKNTAADYLPSKSFLRSLLTFLALTAAAAALILPAWFQPDEPGIDVIFSDTARQLANAAESEPSFTPLADKMNRLAEEMRADDGQPKVAPGELDDLARMLTEQIDALERNTFSDLFEDRGVPLSDDFGRLSDGDMTLPETREFILDLLSNMDQDVAVRQSIRESFRDFSARGDQKKLADEIMESLAPEDAGLRTELIDALETVEEAAENEAAGSMPPESEQTSRRVESDEESSTLNEIDSAGMTTTAAGDTPGTGADAQTDFIPYEEELPELKLPEADSAERSDQGIMRLEGQEDFSLDRIVSDRFEEDGITEAEIMYENIPTEKRDLVKEYFSVIGTEKE